MRGQFGLNYILKQELRRYDPHSRSSCQAGKVSGTHFGADKA